MKRKILLLMIAVLAADMAATAQIVTSKSRLVMVTPLEKTWYVTAGGALTGSTTAETSPYAGFKAGVGFERMFKRGVSEGSMWGVEIGVTSRGYSYNQDNIYDASLFNIGAYFHPQYAFRKALGSGKKAFIEPHVGPYLSFDFVDDSYGDEWGWSSWGTTSYGTPPSYSVYPNVESTIDVGINLGMRYWFSKRVNADLSFRMGFIPFNGDHLTINYTWFNGYGWEKSTSNQELNGLPYAVTLSVGVRLNK